MSKHYTLGPMTLATANLLREILDTATASLALDATDADRIAAMEVIEDRAAFALTLADGGPLAAIGDAYRRAAINREAEGGDA